MHWCTDAAHRGQCRARGVDALLRPDIVWFGERLPAGVLDRIEAFVTEAGLSRMYAGIHYRFDITAGSDLGNAVGNWAIAHASLID